MTKTTLEPCPQRHRPSLMPPPPPLPPPPPPPHSSNLTTQHQVGTANTPTLTSYIILEQGSNHRHAGDRKYGTTLHYTTCTRRSGKKGIVRDEPKRGCQEKTTKAPVSKSAKGTFPPALYRSRGAPPMTQPPVSTTSYPPLCRHFGHVGLFSAPRGLHVIVRANAYKPLT